MDIALTFIVLAVTLKWGDWRNWKLYYPSILFWALGNFVYRYITIEKPLWNFNTILPDQLAEVLMSLVMFPSFALLFFPYFPKQGVIKKILYVSLWTFVFSFIEWCAVLLGSFIYSDGWSFFYSILFNLAMFTLLIIHYRDPRWAWIISLLSAVVIIFLFKIPWRLM